MIAPLPATWLFILFRVNSGMTSWRIIKSHYRINAKIWKNGIYFSNDKTKCHHKMHRCFAGQCGFFRFLNRSGTCSGNCWVQKAGQGRRAEAVCRPAERRQKESRSGDCQYKNSDWPVQKPPLPARTVSAACWIVHWKIPNRVFPPPGWAGREKIGTGSVWIQHHEKSCHWNLSKNIRQLPTVQGSRQGSFLHGPWIQRTGPVQSDG